jgi:hypothetical protein
VEKRQINLELNPYQSAELLWENFENTGSVNAFLLFLAKTENSVEADHLR